MSAWPPVRLAELLRRSSETIDPLPDTDYREITVRLWGKGVVERGLVTGLALSGRRFVAHEGQFIASRIDARNGAMGLVPASLDGALVTNDFPLFDLNLERLYSPYLGWLCRTASFVELCMRASEGTTNRVRLKEETFLALEIALPPLPEQQRLVAHIDELASTARAASTLSDQAILEIDALVASASNKVFATLHAPGNSVVALETLGDIRSGVTLGRTLSGQTIRLPYLRVANVQDGRLDLEHIKHIEVLNSERDKWKLLQDDLLLTEGGDWDKLGRCALWTGAIDDCIHQNHIFRVRLDKSSTLPTYLARLIGSPVGKAYFQTAAKQTTNLASINQRQLRAFPVPLPPLAEQHRIVAELDALQAEVDALKAAQATSRAELDALLPAVLDRAFAGAL